MVSKKLITILSTILSIILIALIGLNIFQFTKNNSLEQTITQLNSTISELQLKVKDAVKLSNSLRIYLNQIGKACPGETTDFLSLSQCIESLSMAIYQKPTLEAGGFINYFPDTGSRQGALIVKNVGPVALDSNKFKLYLNRKIQDNDGCELGGMINPGEPCKLNFYETCEMGCILEVEYDSKRVLKQTY